MSVIIILLVVPSMCYDESSQLRTKTYNISSFAAFSTTDFPGYVLGETSGDLYLMIGDTTSNTCAVIRETRTGTEVWAKLYSSGRCAGLAVDSSETYAYFTDYGDSLNELRITQINCSDGATNKYYTSSDYEADSTLTDIAISSSGDTVYIANQVESTSNTRRNLCKWTVASTNLECSELGTNVLLDVMDLYTSSDTWLYMLLRDDGDIFRPTMIDTSGSSVTWSNIININAGGTSYFAQTSRSDFDGANLHIGIPFDRVANGLFMIIDQSSGNLVGNMKQVTVNSATDFTDLYVDANNVTWITTTDDDTSNINLIKYDQSSGSFTTYTMQDASFLRVFVIPTSNDYVLGYAWITRTVTEARLTNLDKFTEFSLTTSTSAGVSDANSTFTYTSGSFTLAAFNTTAWTTSSTNAAGTLTYSRQDVVYGSSSSGSSDDDLSDGEIAGIVIGTIAGVAIIGLAVFLGILICYKKGMLCFNAGTAVTAIK